MLHLISSDVYAFIDDVVGEYMHERVDNVNAPCAAADSARWVRPRETRYRGRYTMLQLPPPSQGTTTLDILRLLEKSSIPSDQPLSPEAVHAHVMAKRVAFAARAARGRADPRLFIHSPTTRVPSTSQSPGSGFLTRLFHLSRHQCMTA